MPVDLALAAGGVLVLLLSLLAFRRARRAEEWERFHQISELTSSWSREPRPEQAPRVDASAH